MFTQGSKSPDMQSQETSAGASRSSDEPSIISTDLKVVGNLHCAGDIQIKGTVEGDIRSRTVTVGEGAHVQGSVHGDSVHVSGSVKGQIEAPTVTIAKTAKILGDITHQSLSVEAGAFLEGQCHRLDSKKAGEQPGVSEIKASAASQPDDPGKRTAGGSAS
jgi:cytoskeletal protein CcmA (bactofilin family)